MGRTWAKLPAKKLPVKKKEKKTCLKTQPESKLLLSTISVTLGERKYVSDDSLHNLK